MDLLLQLFFSFLQIGLLSVGGGYAAIPLIQEQVVTINKLLTMEQFTDLITIAEMTPGPIAINSATFVGIRLGGLPGMLLCTIGCIIPSFIICLTLAYFYYKYRNFSGVQKVLAALRPAVVALIANAGLSILLLGVFHGGLADIALENFHVIEFLLFAGAFFAIRKWKIGAITAIFGTGVVGTILSFALGLV
ncbi:MAG: chromate transporter [Lachnospiraceae bacterium]|nr:chromate transporter [Lachnospiraceae bacterium]